MPKEIILTEEEMEALQDKLDKYKDSLPENESKLLESLLNIAKEERDKSRPSDPDPGWIFTWTYRF